jgi:hypothetical protein
VLRALAVDVVCKLHCARVGIALVTMRQIVGSARALGIICFVLFSGRHDFGMACGRSHTILSDIAGRV